MNYNPNTVTKTMDLIIPFVRVMAGLVCFALFATAASGYLTFVLFGLCIFVILVLKDPTA